MVRSRQAIVKQAIVPSKAPSEDDVLLRHACPDLDDWPVRWQYEPKDIAPGIAIVAILKPFLLNMLHSKPSRATFNRHRDNLWLVGGEFIRLRYEDPDLHRMSIDHLVQHLIEEDGGPLLWPRISESEQSAIDATCRKLYRFLNPSTSAE